MERDDTKPTGVEHILFQARHEEFPNGKRNFILTGIVGVVGILGLGAAVALPNCDSLVDYLGAATISAGAIAVYLANLANVYDDPHDLLS